MTKSDMKIIALEDFEVHAGLASILNEEALNELAFSQFFVFLVVWAKRNNVLSNELCSLEGFVDSYPRLLNGDISFDDFVLNILGGKLQESYFSEEIIPFIKDYVEYDGYVDDLTSTYNTNIGNLPKDFNGSEKIFKAINTSRINYEANKANYPELVVFTDPEQLKRERENL